MPWGFIIGALAVLGVTSGFFFRVLKIAGWFSIVCIVVAPIGLIMTYCQSHYSAATLAGLDSFFSYSLGILIVGVVIWANVHQSKA